MVCRLNSLKSFFFKFTLALSLPILVAAFIGYVRTKPQSAAGQLFARARENKEQVSKAGGYLVGVVLIVMGVLNL